MYGSDAGQPVPSLYTKGLSPLCDSKRNNVTLKVKVKVARMLLVKVNANC